MFDRLHRHGRLIGIGLAAALLNACGGGSASSPEVEPFYIEEQEEWRLVWADEFDGSSVDSSNWTFQTGNGSDNGLPGWGNYELQYYQADNASIQEVDGESALVIEARQESVGNSDYTSSRMRSINKFDFQYGRVEIRAKAAPGDGMWSAIWMLPSNSPYGVWAASGEVDIMEVVNAGTENQGVFLAAHYGFEWPLNQITSAGADVDDASDWHTYALEWSGDYLRWFVDGEHLRTVSKDVYYSYYFKDNTDGYQLATNEAAPFDRDFHLLVNLAVGGIGPGVELDPAAVPGEMVVDYIRVYECTYATGNGTGCNTYADRSIESPDAQSPEVVTTEIYTDAVGPLTWEFLTGDVTRDLQAQVGYNNDGAIGISVSEVAVEGRGMVLDVVSDGGGNVVINAVDGDIIDVYGHRGGGELKFDMYIDSSMTAPGSTISIKMDSGYPALGFVALDVADMPTNEWFSYSVSINQLLGNPGERALALGAVRNLVVIEPSAAAHVQLDNIRLVCGTPNGDCGIAAPARSTDDLVITVIDENGQAGSAWSPGICAVSAENDFSADYCDGSTSNQVTWSVVPTGDDEVGMNAVEVNWGAGVGGAWFIKDDQGLDLSDSAGGILKFDINLSAATAADGIIYKVENDYPQGTGPIDLDLGPYVPGTWASVEVPIADLVLSTNAELNNPPGGPLNLAAVKAFLVLSPNGEQGGKSLKVANVRIERPGSEQEEEDTGILGTWRLKPVAEALWVGPVDESATWWANDESALTVRNCLFDDEYTFSRDGTFSVDYGDATWLEGWQGVAEEQCGAPVAPHDGSIAATFEYDEDQQMLTLNGQGAHIGLAKVYNGCEIGAPGCAAAIPGDAPSSITYDLVLNDDGTATAEILVAAPGKWRFELTKVAEPPAPAAVVGSWKLAPVAEALWVGPADESAVWWASDESTVTTRGCLFDDVIRFGADGSVSIDQGGETWLEPWQVGAEECGTPIAPHDGSNDGTYAYDADAGTLTVNGQGTFIGLPKVYNGGEIGAAGDPLQIPGDAPSSITYDVTLSEDANAATFSILVGDPGKWRFEYVRVPDAPPSPIVGNWKLAPVAEALWVGPADESATWWASDESTVTARDCLFDDVLSFGADGSVSISQGDETWLEPWQAGAEECGAPISPHDGANPGTYVYDEDAGTLTVNGQGTFVGLPKVYNGGEIGAAGDPLQTPGEAPSSITYDVVLSEDASAATFSILVGDPGKWRFEYVRM